MTSLRRDLLERRLWPLAALLVIALVAVPVLMLRHPSGGGAEPASPPDLSLAALPTTATTAATGASAPTFRAGSGTPRNPFATSTPKLASTQPASPGSSPTPALSSYSTAATAGATASTAATTGAQTSSATTAATNAARTSAATTAATNAARTSAATTAATTVTPTPTTRSESASTTTETASTHSSSALRTSSPAAVEGSSTSRPGATTKAQSWTIYAVDLRIGPSASAQIRRNVARLTPLPSDTSPKLMFVGVMAGGAKAVFALGAGVLHRGQGECRPQRQVCSAIVLSAGQTEQISFPTANGGLKHLILRLVALRNSITHSHATALAAYERRSAAGLCDLALAAPMSYSQSDGTVSGTAGTACKGQPAPIPFPSAPTSQ